MYLASGRQAWRRVLLVGAASLATIAALIPVFLGEGFAWPQATAYAVNVVLPGAALAWIAWRLLMRSPGSQPWARAAFMHAAMATAFSATWTATIIILGYPIQPEAAIAFLRGDAGWHFVFGLVVYGAIATTARATRTQARLKEQELAAANAELQALRAQLDPHFLFNTLHSLTQLAREDPGATENALERFGELMRYVLHAGREATAEVPLEDEIRFVRHYLALERLRLGNRLGVVEDLDPDALELAVPPLLLQPLIENAVRHGLAPRRAGGTIRLRAQVAGEMLAIEVADDGNGADPAAWRASDRLGLKVVRRQIEARSAGAGTFEVVTRPGAGFTVRINLPARIPGRGSSWTSQL